MTTRIITRTIKESIPDGKAVYDRDRSVVSPVSVDVKPGAVVTRGSDGVDVIVSNPPNEVEYAVEMVPVDRARDLDAFTALQIGMSEILSGIIFSRHDLGALLCNGDLQSDTFRLERVILDWPTQQDDVEPFPSALIMCPGERTYEHNGMPGATLIEESLDVYGEGTILRLLATVECKLEITIWSAHKEERRGIMAGLERALLAEPGDERSGRRVVLSPYYDRIAGYDLSSASYMDSSDSAQANRWVVQAKVDASIDRVMLVPSPGLMSPRFAACTE